MPYSVPFANGRPLPINVLENIAFHLVCAPSAPSLSPSANTADSHPYLYGPPAHFPPCLPLGISRLPALLSVSSAVYEALSPGIATSKANGERYPLQTELYARLYCQFLDTGAVGRRWKHTRGERKRTTLDEGDAWDREVQGVTNAGLTAQLVQVCNVLRFYINGAKALGIPLPAEAQDRGHEKAKQRGPQAALRYFDLEKVLLTTFLLMTEDDGLNHHQLRLVSAPLFVDMLIHRRLNEHIGKVTTAIGREPIDVRYNDGWPVENVLNTLIIWLCWMFTTQEKIASESLAFRETTVNLILPFVLCPFRYASALVPPTHFTLPLKGESQYGAEDAEDIYQRPLTTPTAHGSFPVYHSYPHTPSNAGPVQVPILAALNQAAPAPVAEPIDNNGRDPTMLNAEPVQEDSTRDELPSETTANMPQGSNTRLTTPPSQASPDSGPSQIESNARPDAAGGDEATSASTAVPASAAPSPTPQPLVRLVTTAPQRPPPTESNSQAHPSFGVYASWYCSPYDALDEGELHGVHQHLGRTGGSPFPATSTASTRPVSPTTTTPMTIPQPASQPTLKTPLPGVIIYLPLITAGAKLVMMSRREASPLPVLPHLPVDRAAAIRSGWMWSGPTQADMRELGNWCTWGRRRVLPPPSEAASASAVGGMTNTNPDSSTVVGSAVADRDGAKKGGGGKGGKRDEVWYTDSRRWDADWWRMRLCGGMEWQKEAGPVAVMYKQPRGSLAWRMGSVYVKGMLTGLWQGYMHMPNEPLLRYVAMTRQFPSNFSEDALNVMMRPVLMRLAEHVWVPTPSDPGRFAERSDSKHAPSAGLRTSRNSGKGKAKAGTMRYWERSVSHMNKGDSKDKGGYEYLAPVGSGPVPVARPTTMTRFAIDHGQHDGSRGDAEAGEMEESDEDDEEHEDYDDDYDDESSSSETEIETDNEDEGESEGEDERPNATRPTRFQGDVPIVRSRSGFLDENMNNAWLPGPVGSLKWEEGTVTSASASAADSAGDGGYDNSIARNGGTRHTAEEEGVDEGVWRDKFVDAAATRGSTKLKMKSVTFVIPPTLTSTTAQPTEGAGAGAGGGPAIRQNAAAANIPGHDEDDEVAHDAGGGGENDNTTHAATHSRQSYLMTTRIDNPNAPLPPLRPGESESDADRPVMVPGTMHTYETYDPSGEREGVHHRMEKALGSGVCRGVLRRKFSEDGSGQYKHYTYPHPGCLRCREREEVVDMRKKKEKDKMKHLSDVDEDAVQENSRSLGVEALFASVGLGRPRSSTDADASESEDEDGEEIKGRVVDINFSGGDMKHSTHGGYEDDELGDSDESNVRGQDVPSCEESAEDIILTGGMDERHAQAWGPFRYYGRVRPWDGLVGILRVGTQEENLGTQFFFYGYIYGGRTFVGNWRFAAADAVSPTMESSFILSRRGEQ